jgi:hypothetical protein
MEWRKSPEELVEFLHARMKGVEAEGRKMFGYPCYFVSGNMFVGLFQDDVFLRISLEDQKKVLAKYKGLTPFEPLPGRKMKEYMVIPKDVYTDKKAFDELLKISFGYMLTLPIKLGKAKKSDGSKAKKENKSSKKAKK